MEIKGTLLDYVYEKDFLFKMVVYSLKTHFDLPSTMAAQSLYAFINKNGLGDEHEQSDLENYYEKWKASCPIPKESDFETYSTSLNNALAKFYKLPLYVEEDEEKERALYTLFSGNDGQLTLDLCITLSGYHRLLRLWRKNRMKAQITNNFKYDDTVTKKWIQEVTNHAFLVSIYNTHRDEDFLEKLCEHPLIKLTIPIWFLKLARLYYGKGISFDENNYSERASALQWLNSIGGILLGDKEKYNQILSCLSYLDIRTEDAFFNTEVYFSSDCLTSESEECSAVAPNTILLKGKGGRKLGCWLASEKREEEAIWREVIRKSVWNDVMGELAIFEFPDFTPLKIKKVQIQLAAALIYRGAENRGIAKKFGKGLGRPYKRALDFVEGFDEELMPKYMLLLDTWHKIKENRSELSKLTNDRLVYNNQTRRTTLYIKESVEKSIYETYSHTDRELGRVLEANITRIQPVLTMIEKKLDRKYLEKGRQP